MGVVGVASLDGLLRCEEALLVLGDAHQGGKRITFLCHAHILNIFEELCKAAFGQFDGAIALASLSFASWTAISRMKGYPSARRLR
jgi:hypothetical protein